MTMEGGKPDQQHEIIIPLFAEERSIAKRRIVTGRTRIATITRKREEEVQAPLTRELVEIERRPIDRQVDSVPSIRQEGDTIVIPVVEERFVMERRLILKEEVRVTRVRKTEIHRERVVTRKQDVTIERLPARATHEP